MARIEAYDANGTLLHSEDTDPDGNEATMREQAAAAIATTRTFLDLASPTNAQTLAQVKHLSRVSQALIRLELSDFSESS